MFYFSLFFHKNKIQNTKISVKEKEISPINKNIFVR